jgi:hypothetical protein
MAAVRVTVGWAPSAFFDHPGIDAVTAALGQFFGAAGHSDESIRVDEPEIIPIEPSILAEQYLARDYSIGPSRAASNKRRC